MIKNIFKHFILITRHRLKVRWLMFRIGLIWQGLVHDLSKYSWTEFSEGIKYYQGDYSPNQNAKNQKGYSEAWLHHFGRNKHHHEYWHDYNAPIPNPIIPYKYVAEMVCDQLAAGMIYNEKNWTLDSQLNYWLARRKKYQINPLIDKFLVHIFEEVAKHGIKKVITKKNLQNKYQELVLKHDQVTNFNK